MSVDELIEMDQYNLDHIRRGLPHFTELVPSMFALYERARGLIPRQLPPLFGQTLLLCHKAFFCAAVTIGRRHPDDAAPITRRAIEAVRLAVAAKADPNVLDEWKAYTTRLARWEARARGEKPKAWAPSVKTPQHPQLEHLLRYLGALSDASVHFTPEYVSGQQWRAQAEGDHGFVELPFMSSDQEEIERELVMLCSVHLLILSLLDECLERAL